MVLSRVLMMNKTRKKLRAPLSLTSRHRPHLSSQCLNRTRKETRRSASNRRRQLKSRKSEKIRSKRRKIRSARQRPKMISRLLRIPKEGLMEQKSLRNQLIWLTCRRRTWMSLVFHHARVPPIHLLIWTTQCRIHGLLSSSK